VDNWFNTARSSAVRFVRMDGARTVLLRPNISPLAKAAAFAVLFTLIALSLLIIIPLMVFIFVVFLASFAVLKIRDLLASAFHILPRRDGRDNVRVRLPADTTK
jgi:hypothetical protein